MLRAMLNAASQRVNIIGTNVWSQIVPPVSRAHNSSISLPAVGAAQWHFCTASCPGGSSNNGSSSNSSSRSVLSLMCQSRNLEARQQICHPATVACLQARAAYSSSGDALPASSSNSSSLKEQVAEKQADAARMRRRKLMQHEFKSQTLGLIMDEYTPPVPLTQAGVLPHPLKTSAFIWQRIKGKIFTIVAVQAALNNIPGLSKGAIVETIADMYRRINKAQAEYKLDLVKDLVSKDLFRKLQLQTHQRQQGHWDVIEWSLEDPDELAKDVQLVHGRYYNNENQSVFDWIQLTYRIRSKQRFAAYQVKGDRRQLVAGDPAATINVEDYWVFEHKTKKPVNKEKQPVEGGRWRLVGRLNV